MHLNSGSVVLFKSGREPSLATLSSNSLPLWMSMVASLPSSIIWSGPSAPGHVIICSAHHQYSARVSPFHAAKEEVESYMIPIKLLQNLVKWDKATMLASPLRRSHKATMLASPLSTITRKWCASSSETKSNQIWNLTMWENALAGKIVVLPHILFLKKTIFPNAWETKVKTWGFHPWVLVKTRKVQYQCQRHQ